MINSVPLLLCSSAPHWMLVVDCSMLDVSYFDLSLTCRAEALAKADAKTSILLAHFLRSFL
jgi:hypothetical protein